VKKIQDISYYSVITSLPCIVEIVISSESISIFIAKDFRDLLTIASVFLGAGSVYVLPPDREDSTTALSAATIGGISLIVEDIWGSR
jgi:hypothetical protein